MKHVFRVISLGYWGAYPETDSATSSFLLECDNCHVLLDCGSGVLQYLQNYMRPDQLDAVVLTHYHADHIADIGCLQYAIRVSQSLSKVDVPLSIYGHGENEKHRTLSYKTNTRGIIYSEESEVNIGPFSFGFFKAKHPEVSFAIRVSVGNAVISFSGDTEYDPNILKAADRADVFYCESSLYNAYAGAVEGHLTAGEAGRIAREAGVKELVLTHLPHFGNHQDMIPEASGEFSGPVCLNKAGMVREIPVPGL